MKKTLGLLVFLSLEVALLQIPEIEYKRYILLINGALLVLLGAMMTFKLDTLCNFPRLFTKLIKNDLYSISGVVLILFTIINIGWFQDLLREDFIKFSIVLFISMCALVFMLEKDQNKTNSPEQIKVLITGAALSPYRDETIILTPDNKKELLESSDWERWNPIRELIKTYPSIEQVRIVGSKKNKLTKDDLADMIDKGFPERTIEFLGRFDINVFSFKEVFLALEEIINSMPYKDENLLFNVTSGTKIVSLAIAFHTVKGERRIVYHDQDFLVSIEENRNEFELNVKAIKPVLKNWLEEEDYS